MKVFEAIHNMSEEEFIAWVKKNDFFSDYVKDRFCAKICPLRQPDGWCQYYDGIHEYQGCPYENADWLRVWLDSDIETVDQN